MGCITTIKCTGLPACEIFRNIYKVAKCLEKLSKILVWSILFTCANQFYNICVWIMAFDSKQCAFKSATQCYILERQCFAYDFIICFSSLNCINQMIQHNVDCFPVKIKTKDSTPKRRNVSYVSPLLYLLNLAVLKTQYSQTRIDWQQGENVVCHSIARYCHNNFCESIKRSYSDNGINSLEVIGKEWDFRVTFGSTE